MKTPARAKKTANYQTDGTATANPMNVITATP
jgi:hypothetical protein